MVKTSLIRWNRNRFRPAVVAVMVLLAIWNGRVVAGCICADGHYESSCQAMNHSREAGKGDRHSHAGCCCKKTTPNHAGTDCCGAPKACCQRDRSAKTSDSVNPSLSGRGCCTPVVRAQVIPTLVAKLQLEDGQHLLALFAIIFDRSAFTDAMQVTRRVESDVGPPPDDLIVTLRRFVI